MKSWLVWQDPDTGEDWGQEEKGMTEDEMVAWHHRLDGPGFEWTWSCWWIGRPGMLQFMGLQRVRHDWLTDWSTLTSYFKRKRLVLCTICHAIYFSFSKIIFYWRMIALQTFALFCQISVWISHRSAYIPSFLKLLPIPCPTPNTTPLGWYRAPVWVSWAIQ